jgi:para-aminobenzoate synthetase component 1
MLAVVFGYCLFMRLDIRADELVGSLLTLAADGPVCILDSCRVGYLGSHLLIAGIEPVAVVELSDADANVTLKKLDDLSASGMAAIFTISYDLGRKLLDIGAPNPGEPDLFAAMFDVLLVHDYADASTRLVGNADKLADIRQKLSTPSSIDLDTGGASRVTSNFSTSGYMDAIETIRERIRCGDTYQTNLTQQLTAELPRGLTPEIVFARLRRDHPAPFASFIKRDGSTVVSASPERFFKITDTDGGRLISTSPIKGTRQRGGTPHQDQRLRTELLNSAKDRAENTMIVDLLRNDIGRVCEFGSVRVNKLCELEEHPTFFHLVSTIDGVLRPNATFSDVLKAAFPCGSITGAPKISTMRMIDDIEHGDRGLSMGAIGYYAPPSFALPAMCDLSVAIRTMVVRDRAATFNVGGGITIDSDPKSEYEESLVKAKGLLSAINGTLLA